MAKRLVRVLLIGAGRAGLVHGRNLAGRIAQAELVAVCDAHEPSLAAAADELGVALRFTDYRQALAQADAEAVVIVTPTFLHREVAVAAAESGCHVFLEKPMALGVAECREIIAAAERARVRLQIGFMRRFDEGFLQARRVLDSGELGRVMIIKSTGRGPGGPGPWMWDLKKSNGIIAEVNSHDIDSLHWYTGSAVTRVFASARNFKMPEARAAFPDFYDNVVAQLQLADGTLGTIDGTCPAHYGYDARVEILCERGVIFVGSARQHGCEYISVESGLRGSAVQSWRTLFDDAYRAEMVHFVDGVISGEPPGVTGLDGLRAVATAVAINESIRTAAPVDVEAA